MSEEPPDPRIARNKRRRRVLIVVCGILAITAAWLFRPHWHADESRVEPRLLALKKPYRMVNSGIVFDGGSVSMEITDAGGNSEYFFIPNAGGWRNVFIRTRRNTRDGEIPASNPAATLQELAAILADHCDEWEDYENLAKMTGRLGDKIKERVCFQWEKLRFWWNGIDL